MKHAEINQLWNSCRQQSRLERFPRWLDWRVTKKVAKWTGKPRKRETTLFWGQEMTIVYPEYVSSKLGQSGYFEVDLTSMFVDVLSPGMIVYDVGSHFGYFSLLASELVGDSGRVYAFEPTGATYEVLAENAARRANIQCHNLAVFRQSGEISFLDQGLNSSSINFVVGDTNKVPAEEQQKGHLVTVRAVKLDDFADQHQDPDFVKIDAEGAEGPILEGMNQIILRSQPCISLEVGDGVSARTGNQPCRRNVELLLDHGYTVFDYRSCRAQPHQVSETYSYDNLLFRHPNWRPKPMAKSA
ncbi:MAG: FkbM family methyltransferase [Pirellulales bacterium]|nr:FkbM family methyltransferase [Pirellulales bacterium]